MPSLLMVMNYLCGQSDGHIRPRLGLNHADGVTIYGKSRHGVTEAGYVAAFCRLLPNYTRL